MRIRGIGARGSPKLFPTPSTTSRSTASPPLPRHVRPSRTLESKLSSPRLPLRPSAAPEPGLTERAVEFAQDVLDQDVSEVLETVQQTTDAAMVSTQGLLQETAAALGLTAVAKAFQGLSGPFRAMLLLNLSSALFGSNQVAMKVTEAQMSPDAISAFRFLFAAAFFLPSIVRGLKNPALRKSGLELGFWLFGGYLMQAVGLETTTAAHGSFTGTITVLVVPLLVGLSGRRVSPITWAASLVALLGVALLTTSDTTPNMGDALCILSAALFGVHKWRSESTTIRFRENTQELVAVQLGALAALACTLEIPKVAGLLRHNSPGEIMTMASGLPWPLLFYMGLATTGFTLWVEINALKDVSAPLAALIYTSEPLWGALLAWTLLGEHWGATGWVGAFLIVASSLAAQLNTGDEKASDKERPSVKAEAYETSDK